MIARSPRRHRWLGIYLVVTCFLLGGFLLRMWYGFDRVDETTGIGDRIVTITQSAYGYGPDIWSVGETSITIYRASDHTSEEVPIDAEAAALLKGEVVKIPDSIRGTYTSDSSCDGLYLEVAFTADGKYRHDQIASNHVYIKELETLFKMINELLPKDRGITFNTEMWKWYEKEKYCNVSRLTQSELNRMSSNVLAASVPVNWVRISPEEIFQRPKTDDLAVVTSKSL